MVGGASCSTSETDESHRCCPCASYPLDRIVEMVMISGKQNDETTESLSSSSSSCSFLDLIHWIRHGKNLPCTIEHLTRGCRLRTARRIQQALRDSFPTPLDHDTSTVSTMNLSTSPLKSQRNSSTISSSTTTTTITNETKLVLEDAKDFPPLPVRATNTHTTPVSSSLSAVKKGKRRIRPAMIQSTPFSSSASSSSTGNSSVWGQLSVDNNTTKTTTASISSLPLFSPQTTTRWPANQEETLLERRLSYATTTNNISSSNVDKSKVPCTTPTSSTPATRNTTMPPSLTTPSKSRQENLVDNRAKGLVDESWIHDPVPATVHRLIDLYDALVQASLVSSTPAEVHFVLSIFRGATTQEVWQAPAQAPFPLLLHSTTTDTQDDNNDDVYKKDAFRKVCLQFSSLLLTKWASRFVHWGFASSLVECPPLQQFCPNLFHHVQDHLSQQSSDHGTKDTPRTTTPFWTLPFDEMRDSRNRYRTQGEMALYKNREETRDAFLSHLRSFYKQGSSVQIHHSKSPEQVRKAARSVLDPLLDDNLPWLAEFFTDILLQLGSVPVPETDKEVLKMADQEKVQKLHQRFKEPARKGPSRNSRGADGKKPLPILQEGSRITMVQEEFFRGHQEFFYYFVVLADSHKLNHHLRYQFLDKLLQISSSLSATHVDRGLENLCLLARFLGVLVFAPNWHSVSISLDDSRSRSLAYDELGLLRFGGKSMTDYLQMAWERCRLISVVPWLVEMLRMSVWDETFRRATTFQTISHQLRWIQLQLMSQIRGASLECREVLALCIESFVDEIAGLDWIEETKPPFVIGDSWHSQRGDSPENLDTLVVSFERGTILALNGRTEAVLNLVSDMTRSSRGLLRSPGISRKVRPSFVEPALDNKQNISKVKFAESEPVVQDKIQTQLRASFFHLHRDLQVICDFTVERALHNMHEFFKAIHTEEFCVYLPDESVDWDETQRAVTHAYKVCMESQLESCIGKSLDLFAPKCHEDVKSIAIFLSVEQGMKTCLTRLDSIASESVRNAKASHLKSLKRNATNLFVKADPVSVSLLSEITEKLTAACDMMDQFENHPKEKVWQALQSVVEVMDEWIATKLHDNVSETALRCFFVAVARLNALCPTVLSRMIGHNVDLLDWLLVSELFRIAGRSLHWGSFGLIHVTKALSDPDTIRWFISCGLEKMESQDSVVHLIEELCRERVIPAALRPEAQSQVVRNISLRN